MANKFGISLEDAIRDLKVNVDDAIDFMWSEFEDDWAKAERYYAGESDLPTEEGRSNAVKTEVRDIIRAVTPSILRVLYQSRKPVEYQPTHISHAALVDQQALYIRQLFASCGGYKILYNITQQAMRVKGGPVKVFHEPEPTPEFIQFSALTQEEVDELKALPDFEVDEVKEHPKLGDEGFFTISGYQYKPFGKLVIEDFPMYEFFVSRNATSLEEARVHGHYRAVKVAEAIEMGLDHDDWTRLAGTDPEEKHASSTSRAVRGYQTNHSEDETDDILQTEILLTEVYCKYDLDGDGKEERYVFYMGGPNYEYIDHFPIEDYCIELGSVDPQPYTVIGRSLAQLLIESQDNETSILRAIIDNAHMANNPRYAGDPTTTNFKDLMNNAIGAPIKTRGAPNFQVTDIPFTGGNLIPFLQYMEQDTENKVGVTKSATGLDPDALQSTDKEAVRNTIALSQGQVELMARNLVETCLIGIFKKLLKLSQRHMDRLQVVRTSGKLIPVDITLFDPSLAAEPNVGLGTASHEQKLATLNFVLGKQEQILQSFGIDNPFTSLSQMYNTLEDIVDLGGLKDPGRYFSIITPEMEEAMQAEREAEQQAAQQAAEETQAAQQPIDPGLALVEGEKIKAQASMMGVQFRSQIDAAKLQQEGMLKMKELDLDRDELAQKRIIELRKISADRLNTEIQAEQRNNDADGPPSKRSTASG